MGNFYLISSLKPVNFFLRKLQARGIDSPEKAARFVSLIPFKPFELGRMGSEPKWREMHCFLVERKGNAFDHAILLCSLFLGFSLDAYVCLGSSSDGPHAWVLVISQTKHNGNVVGKKFEYWESLTGKKYDQKNPRVNYLYRRIGCVFNNEKYYANLQKSDTVLFFLLKRL